jgi:acetolactate synthase-1/2/3 large subunit
MSHQRKTVAQAVVDGLLQNGVRSLFCMPGIQNDHLFNALYDVQDKIRIVNTRHEQGAAYMALGAAMATGEPAAFCVVPGPGVLNTTAALSTAYACNAPVLALTGQIPQKQIGRGFGFLHELPDQLAVLRSLTKWAARITGPHDAMPLVNEAFRQMRSGRPRPVSLECPIDVWGRDALVADEPPVEVAPPPVDVRQVERAVQLLLAAAKPLILVGGGAQHASSQVTALSKLLQAPVVSGRMGRGIVDGRDPLSVNWTAGHRLWRDADVVLAVGTRLQVPQMVWGTDAKMKIIRIDIDAEEIERFAVPAVGILGDAAATLEGLLSQLHAAGVARPSRATELSALKETVAGELSYLEPQRGFLEAIRAALPEDGIFVDELTQVGYASRLLLPVYRPRTFLTPAYQGTLGWGYPTALGAKVARPDAAVVSVNGDGGFMFNVQELATAVRHKIAVVAIVFEDGAFGNVKRIQTQQFAGRTIASDLTNPDFMALARSFGMRAIQARTPAELNEAVRHGISLNEPVLIHVPVGEMPDPWSFINMPPAR